jgi:hypothetical protein
MNSTWMSPEQAWQWKISLQLRLRQVHGDHFQAFFSKVMSSLHKDDFVPVRAFGSLGDKGCDGYLLSCGRLFQCYGKMEDAAVAVATIVGKINGDFTLAKANFGETMKEWYFVHNLANGLPVEALLAIDGLKKANPDLKIGLMGPDVFETHVFGLDEADLIGLLGPAGTAEHTKAMRVEEVAAIIASIVTSVDADTPPVADPKPVPFNKMDFNKIPTHWRQLLESGSKNARYVDDYLDQTTDPELGQKMAGVFRGRYESLRAQDLTPKVIMGMLYEGITGIGAVSIERQVAAQALLAFLFESCDIFEDDPAKVKT